MLLRVLISVLLVAISLPGAYGNDVIDISEGLYVEGEEYSGPYTGDEEVDFADISDSSSSGDFSEVTSSDAVADTVTTYAEECEEELNWDISDLVDCFMDCLDEFPV